MGRLDKKFAQGAETCAQTTGKDLFSVELIFCSPGRQLMMVVGGRKKKEKTHLPLQSKVYGIMGKL